MKYILNNINKSKLPRVRSTIENHVPSGKVAETGRYSREIVDGTETINYFPKEWRAPHIEVKVGGPGFLSIRTGGSGRNTEEDSHFETVRSLANLLDCSKVTDKTGGEIDLSSPEDSAE